MAAPPPPPPPPPGPGPIGKPNNAKLLDSIHKGIGLKKVPESEKNDRSAVPEVTGKSGARSGPILQPGIKGQSGPALSLADAIKARTKEMDKGNSVVSAAPPKRQGAPSPNQAAPIGNNVPKPPSQNSKPLTTNTESNSFPPPPPPPPTDNSNRPMAPPGNINMPLIPPPMHIGNSIRPPAPPRINENYSSIPPQPPMSQGSLNKPLARPPIPNNMPAIPQYTFDTKINTSLTNHTAPVGSSKIMPPQCAPPPPPSNTIPINTISKPNIQQPSSAGSEVNKPSARIEASSFDSKFTFVEDIYFPDPSTVLKRPKHAV